MVHTEEVVMTVGTSVIRPVSVAQVPHDTLLSWRQMTHQQTICDVRTRATRAAQWNLKLQQFTDRPVVIDWVKVLCFKFVVRHILIIMTRRRDRHPLNGLFSTTTQVSPTRHKIGHFKDVLPSQSLARVWKKRNLKAKFHRSKAGHRPAESGNLAYH